MAFRKTFKSQKTVLSHRRSLKTSSKTTRSQTQSLFLLNQNILSAIAVVLVLTGILLLHRSHVLLGFGFMIFSFLLLAAFYFDWVPGFAPGFSGQRGGKGSNPRINAGKSRPGQTFSLDSKWMLNHKFELGGMALLLLGLLLGFKAQWMVMGSMEMPGLKLWGFYGLAAALFTTGIFLQGLGRKPKGQTVSRSQEEPKPLASIVEWSAFGLIMVFA
ncbi:MAG TPA: hypothetical protein VIJ93_11715, partial [bacterium]